MKNFKLGIIIGVTIVAVILMCIFITQGAQNKAIGLEEAVYTAQSDINVQEKRRIDLIYNLADCVMQYDQHESDTLIALAEHMGDGSANTANLTTEITALAYNYPELKSNENYQQLMNELSITENMIAQYRIAYNQSVNTYNRYVKKFPSRLFLNWTGYEIIPFERLEYEVSSTAPQNLFDR